MAKKALTPLQIWRMPMLLGLSSACGLVAGLLGDGLFDALSWPALAVPALVALRYSARIGH